MVSRVSGIQVFLADGSLAVRRRVRALLAAQGMQVCGEDGTMTGCITAILAARPHVVVLDVHLDGGSGLQVLDAVRQADPAVDFVVFSHDSAPAYRTRYLAAGAACFLDKSSEFDQLARAIRDARAARIP